MRTVGYEILWPPEEAFAVRAMITAIGTKRARAVGHCRPFLEEGNVGRRSDRLEYSNSDNPIRHDEFRDR